MGNRAVDPHPALAPGTDDFRIDPVAGQDAVDRVSVGGHGWFLVSRCLNVTDPDRRANIYFCGARILDGYTRRMGEPLYTLKFGEAAKIGRTAGVSRMTISRAIRGMQCSVNTAKAIEVATKGRIKAVVLLGLKPPPSKKTA